jgi:ubiquinone/menaquinone biosynthesis C-methylase UbiE
VWLVAAALAVLAVAESGAQRPSHGRLFPPQDLGLLEGPDRDAWQRPDQVMDALAIADGSHVADLGAGAGWFTVRLARRVGPNGLVYAEDIQSQMIEAISRRVAREGLRNVRTVLGTPTDARLPVGRLDAVLMVEIYYEIEDPITLLRNVERSLAPKGRLGIVNFKPDGGGPGPDRVERVDSRTVIRDAETAGFRLLEQATFLPYQDLLIFGRAATAPSGVPVR